MKVKCTTIQCRQIATPTDEKDENGRPVIKQAVIWLVTFSPVKGESPFPTAIQVAFTTRTEADKYEVTKEYILAIS